MTRSNLGKPKRFTAPTLEDGTPFSVHPSEGGAALFTGTIQNHIGDLTAFDPTGKAEYVVTASNQTSVPFSISLWHFERITTQGAINFMIDSRHYVGNHKGVAEGSYGWRDDHHFAFELHTLVPMWLSNPAAYTGMPRQITYEPPTNHAGLWGALEPYDPKAPDLVKLIHWGADIIVTQKLDHVLMKEQLAYFLYAWPALEPWLPKQNYQVIKDYALKTWRKPGIDHEYRYDETRENHNLYEVKMLIGTTKGSNPPGHSLLPNLLMSESAKRDGWPEAEAFLNAATEQATWMVKHLDWEDPQVTKGQRMSEHVTMTGLAAFLELCPEQAPAGLAKKIQEWARVMIRRSEDMWDFRRYTDDGDWVPSGEQTTMWNEVGNVVGFPAVLLAAEPFVDNPKEKARLNELVWSHLDNAFGRNPCGRHFSYDAPKEIEGVKYGWYSFYPGGIGQLAESRFVLDGAPKSVHYPYHPEQGNYGWTEGWVSFNTAFNLSLAYLAKAETQLQLEQRDDEVFVSLRAPINFDVTKEEPVILTVTGRKAVNATLRVDSPESSAFVGRVALQDLEVQVGDRIVSAYGYGYMGTKAELKVGPASNLS